MGMTFNKNGFPDAASSTYFKQSLCVKLTDYGYKTADSNKAAKKVWLKATTGTTALGLSSSYTYWGTDKNWDTSRLYKYGTSGGAKLPLVAKYDGGVPTPATDKWGPFNRYGSFTQAYFPTLYVRYDSASNYCQYSEDSSSGPWYNLTKGPGIFFGMTGGGGGGAAGNAEWTIFGNHAVGGGGGGGGGSVLAYFDLRGATEHFSGTVYLEVTLGAGGNRAETIRGDGKSGSASTIVFHWGAGSQTLLKCTGGDGGSCESETSAGGAGGKTTTLASGITLEFLKVFNSYDGKSGGRGGYKNAYGNETNSTEGGSFVTDVKVSMPILADDHVPAEADVTTGRACGRDRYKYNDANCYGGGGGATILSAKSSTNYGSGGNGGPAKQGTSDEGWWGYGADGGPGCFVVFSLNYNADY